MEVERCDYFANSKTRELNKTKQVAYEFLSLSYLY